MQAVLSFFCAVALFFTTIGSYLSPLPQLLNQKHRDAGEREVVLPMAGGSDPWFYEHDGEWYYCYSVGEGVAVRHASHPFDLPQGEKTVVYRAPRGTDYSWAYWAPELHCIDGVWYIYVAACDGDSAHHRMFVLQSDDPLGPFEMVGKLTDSTDKWAIDGTVLPYGDDLYFVWSGWEGDEDGQQNLYIAHMSDPCHIDGERVLLSEPTLLWEKRGMPINEGPQILQKDDTLYIVYSASGSWTDDYCLGMLRFRGGEITDWQSWTKAPLPVLPKREGAYGPGHCSFIRSTDGTDYIVYHANLESGTGWNGRTIRIQPFAWVGGLPVFGLPFSPGDWIYMAP